MCVIIAGRRQHEFKEIELTSLYLKFKTEQTCNVILHSCVNICDASGFCFPELCRRE